MAFFRTNKLRLSSQMPRRFTALNSADSPSPRLIQSLLLLLVFSLGFQPLSAQEPAPIVVQTAQEKAEAEKALAKEARALNKEVAELKKDILELNQSLYRFEEELLHPVETQFSVFLALAPNTRFNLDSIELRLGDTLIASHLYEEKEIRALKTGGIQRLYVGSLSDGKYKLTAGINGQGSSARYHRRKKPIKFEKNEKAKYIQLVVGDDRRTGNPLIKVQQW